jgi:dihydroflavonol-4-reductase
MGNMKILITGATGFLGSYLCRQFVNEGHQVTAFKRANSDTTELKGWDLSYALGDVTDVESLNRAVEGQDVVVHAAAHLAYWRYLRDVQTKVNVEGTRNVVAACRQQGVKRLVLVSSIATIGIPPNPHSPVDETFAFNLQQSGLNYHLSKWQAEAEVLKQPNATLDVVIVNPGSIFGSFGNCFRGGEMIAKVRHTQVVPYFLGGINVVHVDDVVEGISQVVKQGTSGDRYILGGENLTYRQIAEIAAASLGLNRIFVPVPAVVTGLAAAILEPIGTFTKKRPRITYDVHYCASRFHFYDSSKAKKELGYNPRGFKAIVEDYLQRDKTKNNVMIPES